MKNTWKVLLIILAALLSFAFFWPRGAAAEQVEPVSVTDEFTEPAEVLVAPEPEVVAEVPPRKFIGTCRLTVYTPDESSYGYQTATGVRSQHLMTCAVDPSVIPYGSNVIIKCADGSEWRLKAVDCGGFSGRWIDIFFDGSELGGIYWLDEVFGGDHADVYVEAAG